MDYFVNGTLEPKEEGTPIKESTITIKDALPHKIIGEDHQEGKEEEVDNNTTPQMPLHS